MRRFILAYDMGLGKLHSRDGSDNGNGNANDGDFDLTMATFRILVDLYILYSCVTSMYPDKMCSIVSSLSYKSNNHTHVRFPPL